MLLPITFWPWNIHGCVIWKSISNLTFALSFAVKKVGSCDRVCSICFTDYFIILKGMYAFNAYLIINLLQAYLVPLILVMSVCRIIVFYILSRFSFTIQVFWNLLLHQFIIHIFLFPYVSYRRTMTHFTFQSEWA